MTDPILPPAPDGAYELAALLGDYGDRWLIVRVVDDDGPWLIAEPRPEGTQGTRLVRRTAAEMREALEEAGGSEAT
jgi:hypothetical protein